MLFLHAQPNHVARIGKTHDLAPPVGENSEQRYGPGLDPVDVGDLVSLGEEELLLFDTP